MVVYEREINLLLMMGKGVSVKPTVLDDEVVVQRQPQSFTKAIRITCSQNTAKMVFKLYTAYSLKNATDSLHPEEIEAKKSECEDKI